MASNFTSESIDVLYVYGKGLQIFKGHDYRQKKLNNLNLIEIVKYFILTFQQIY